MPKTAETECEVITLEEARAKLTQRQQRLLDLLPQHNWVVAQAAKAAGYAKSYIDTDLTTTIRTSRRFSKALALLKAKIRAESQWTLEGWRQQCEEHQALALIEGDYSVVHQYDADIARHLGAFEKDNRQKGDAGPRIIVNLPVAQKEQPKTVSNRVIEPPAE